ncbi:DUF2924 domain-containing protein [Rhizorhabdus sp.]|uniref:DUF2924 domain-containing protein n=1 Tax=Rhizorhabdus sp. TaxID=1968843 RepID=UPI0019906672|nr:DUF2924 domain-containing protein [Rhizorhabdus sp.]MBD3762566.1 DUF2924 domain-containing protein [Rhizorhabdus sp.]
MSSKLDQRLAVLPTMSMAQLHEEWRRLRVTEPPRLGREILRQLIGYELQAQCSTTAVSKAARALRGWANGQFRSQLKPGTRLVRGWNGETLSVLVTDRGFEYRGKNWTSLSAIAREVTGVVWSGPRFFGLTGEMPHG